MRKGMGQVKVRRIRRPHIIDGRPTGRLGLAIFLVAVALGSWGYLALDLARQQPPAASLPNVEQLAPPDLTDLEQQRLALTDQASGLERRIKTLTEDHQSERVAVREAQSKIEQLQSENAKLRGQLAFLTQLFGGDGGPIAISDLALASEGENAVRYWFKVSRTDAGETMLTGQVHLQVRGLLDGEERYFSLAELSENGRDGHRLGFRNFQEIDGTLRLPEGFQPDELLVIVAPQDKAIGGAKRQFDWLLSPDSDSNTGQNTGQNTD